MTAKFQYIGASIPTSNINHTALFKHGETLPDFKASNFRAMYYTTPQRGGKDLQSREHDEVISRVIKAMGLSVQFVEVRGRRYANIYAKFRTSEGYEEFEAEIKTIIRKFRRNPEPAAEQVPVIVFSDRSKLEGILES